MKSLLFTKPVLLVVGAIVLGAGGFGGYSLFKKNDQKSQPSPITQSDTNQYSGPTDQEKKDAEAHKDDVIKQIQQNSSQPPGGGQKKTVSPVITSAYQQDDKVTVTAYTPGIFDNGGRCTLKATRGSLSVTKTTAAFANVSTTDCEPFNISLSEFPEAGTWHITVTYSSSTAEGVSQDKTLTLK